MEGYTQLGQPLWRSWEKAPLASPFLIAGENNGFRTRIMVSGREMSDSGREMSDPRARVSDPARTLDLAWFRPGFRTLLLKTAQNVSLLFCSKLLKTSLFLLVLAWFNLFCSTLFSSFLVFSQFEQVKAPGTAFWAIKAEKSWENALFGVSFTYADTARACSEGLFRQNRKVFSLLLFPARSVSFRLFSFTSLLYRPKSAGFEHGS